MNLDIVRAWKDEAYRESLSAEERELLLQNPVGELSDEELLRVQGGSMADTTPSLHFKDQTICSDAIQEALRNSKNKSRPSMDQLLKTFGIDPSDMDMGDMITP